MSSGRFASYVEDVRKVVLDFFISAVEFMDHFIPPGTVVQGEVVQNLTERLKQWNIMDEALLLAKDYFQLVHDTCVILSRLLSLLEGAASDPRPRLTMDPESAKLFLRGLMDEATLRFDELVNMVWERAVRLSSTMAPISGGVAVRIKDEVIREIREWVGKASIVIDAYSRAIKAGGEDELVEAVLVMLSGLRLLLEGLKRISSLFRLEPDPTELPLDKLQEIISAVSLTLPEVKRGLEARLNIHQYVVSTLFHMLRVLHGSEKASELLNWLIRESAQSRGWKAAQSLLPEDVNLEELRVGLVIARTNLEDSLRELDHFKRVTEMLSILLNSVDFPLLRNLCEREKEVVSRVESFIRQALMIVRDASIKVYMAMEELKLLRGSG
ncbi:MAG: hypothetical protein KIH01_00800 [Candidatus Freyarchaeota archaeon]|nr:hypothetical protein [Candidatus Jordarchaeia archaeon]